MTSQHTVGVVVIGRNEGQRLSRCLSSPELDIVAKVYVDSGSIDDSVAIARSHSFPVIELNAAVPFTAGRARNAGFEWLATAFPTLEYVQFIDADSVLQPGWILAGFRFLHENEKVAVVSGTLRELDPRASVFNHLCDLEWQVPCGQVLSSGGIAMFRCSAFRSVNGFREDLIAGEEPDLCFRMQRDGWTIFKIDAAMALHDAAMTRVSQWWARNRRSGYATAQAFSIRGSNEAELIRHVVSDAFWGLPISWPLWPFLWIRVWRRSGAEYATHIVLGKVPHLQGQVTFWLDKLRRRQPELIEHK